MTALLAIHFHLDPVSLNTCYVTIVTSSHRPSLTFSSSSDVTPQSRHPNTFKYAHRPHATLSSARSPPQAGSASHGLYEMSKKTRSGHLSVSRCTGIGADKWTSARRVSDGGRASRAGTDSVVDTIATAVSDCSSSSSSSSCSFPCSSSCSRPACQPDSPASASSHRPSASAPDPLSSGSGSRLVLAPDPHTCTTREHGRAPGAAATPARRRRARHRRDCRPRHCRAALAARCPTADCARRTSARPISYGAVRGAARVRRGRPPRCRSIPAAHAGSTRPVSDVGRASPSLDVCRLEDFR
jgi:hypothetical protein